MKGCGTWTDGSGNFVRVVEQEDAVLVTHWTKDIAGEATHFLTKKQWEELELPNWSLVEAE